MLGEIEDILSEGEALLMEPRDQYDSCLIGVGYRFHDGPLAVYDMDRVLSVLGEEMNEEDAQEWFEYNTLGAWMGNGTPIFVRLFK